MREYLGRRKSHSSLYTRAAQLSHQSTKNSCCGVKDRINFDGDLTFAALRWELLETSLVTVPADAAASIPLLKPSVQRSPQSRKFGYD